MQKKNKKSINYFQCTNLEFNAERETLPAKEKKEKFNQENCHCLFLKFLHCHMFLGMVAEINQFVCMSD